MAYAAKVIRDKCIGVASCVAVATDTFSLDEKNVAVVAKNSGDTDEKILLAAKSCPTKAIEVWEGGKKIYPVEQGMGNEQH